MRKALTITWLLALALIIASLFWYNDWVFKLPTPVPDDYKPVYFSQYINLPQRVKSVTGKPVFLHFFNPACPCSRFNIPHFKSLVAQYGAQVDFRIVLVSKKKYTVKDIQDKFDIDIPVFFDEDLAVACGVYATPQAVIIDADNKLFYRGNYNKSRYCTGRETEYARIALNSLVYHKNISFDQSALKAYGCQLPKCSP